VFLTIKISLFNIIIVEFIKLTTMYYDITMKIADIAIGVLKKRKTDYEQISSAKKENSIQRYTVIKPRTNRHTSRLN